MLWRKVLSLIFCAIVLLGCERQHEQGGRPVPPPSPKKAPDAQPNFFVDGVVVNKYEVDGDYCIVIYNHDKRRIVIHGKPFYEKYKIGDKIKLDTIAGPIKRNE